jgi:phage baseplate assembly protein W|tara:strand:- start:3938 stop:4360 length:423 start_codon:yes stop_codon:yes gene_type:complete
MAKDLKSFLGTGWSFPPSFNKHTKAVDMVSDEIDISQSLKIILFTDLGARIMRSNFGSDVKNFTFEGINRGSIMRLSNTISVAIEKHEPRIDLDNVDIDQSQAVDGKLLIKLEYLIKSVNVRTNVVFPFYIKEGTHITDM